MGALVALSGWDKAARHVELGLRFQRAGEYGAARLATDLLHAGGRE